LRSSSDEEETRIEAHGGWPSLALGELWAQRELLGFFVWRDIKVRYKQTLLGAAWALVQPLASLVVFSLIFGRFARLDSAGVPYPAFCLAGLLPWLLFAGGLTGAAGALVNNVNLITKVHFARVLLPLASIAAALVDFAISLALLTAVLAWYGVGPGWHVMLLPLPIGLALAAAAGAGLWLAALNAQYRDVRYAIPFLVQIVMYSTPIVYSLDIVPERWRSIFAINPMVASVEGFRLAVLGTGSLTASLVAVSSLSALGLLASGLLYFRRTERCLADTI
jgi:lipopolysaccharide transport system permease protein